ncbi:MAG: hypothetical protein ACNA7Q_12360 [Rhodobacterales bacterium]
MKNLIHTARIAAAALLLGISPVLADEQPQSWIPSEITLPEDMEVVTDRRIGSAIRVFTFTTQEDGDTLAVKWREALETGPYQVMPAAEGLDQRLIEFSGGRVQNGQIAFSRGADGTNTMVQFDASLLN